MAQRVLSRLVKGSTIIKEIALFGKDLSEQYKKPVFK